MQAQAIPRPGPLNAPDLVGRAAHASSPARTRKSIDGQRRRGEERARQNDRAEFSLHLRFLLSGVVFRTGKEARKMPMCGWRKTCRNPAGFILIT